jgi:Zn-dependent protease
MPSDLEVAVYMLIGLIIGVIFHEYAHGYIAYRMGDTTAKQAGRLTLDPTAHVDPIGTLLLPGFLFLMTLLGRGSFIIGWAKPVPINPFLFRKPRGIIWVSLAGITANLIIAAVFLGIVRILVLFEGGTVLDRVIWTCVYIAYINIVLCIFNLIPIPPLDGSRILAYFLPANARRAYMSIEPYGFLIILLLVIPFGYFLSDIAREVINLIMRLYGL